MRYIKFEPMSRAELEASLASADATTAYTALMGAVYHDEEWHWVQEQCHRFISSSHRQLRVGAIQGLGLIAVFRRELDANRAVTVLTEILNDPDLCSEAQDALDDIRRSIPAARPS